MIPLTPIFLGTITPELHMNAHIIIVIYVIYAIISLKGNLITEKIMEIIITQWALDSYLDLKSANVFSDVEYRKVIRPDVLLLKGYPNDPKFNNGKFWSFAQDRNAKKIPDGYKMEWHNVGDGCVQLRLTVGIFGEECFLCEAYVKHDDKEDRRRLAKFKVYLELIRKGRYTIRGKLT